MNTITRGDSLSNREAPGILESMWRFKFLVLVLVLLFGAAGFALGSRKPSDYNTSATIALVDPKSTGSADTSLTRYAAEQANVATSDEVLAIAAKKLGTTVEALQARVSSSSSITETVIGVTATASSPEAAKARVDAVVDAFTTVLAQRSAKRLSDQATALQKLIDDLNTRVAKIDPKVPNAALVANSLANASTQLLLRKADLQTEAARFGSGVAYAEAASLPTTASSTKKEAALDATVGILLGLLLGGALAWTATDRRRTADDALDAESLLGVPLLGEVPDLKGSGEAASLRDLEAMPAVAYEFVAAGLHDPGVLLVAGAERGAGTTVSALNLAVAAARAGRRVVVIDADNDAQSLTKAVGIGEGRIGLSDVAARRADLDAATTTVSLGSTSMSVIPAGNAEPDAASLFRARSMGDALTELRNRYDLVIIDCPPMATDPEAASLARHVDGLLLVVSRRTRVRILERVRQRMSVLSTPMLGYVFTRGRRVGYVGSGRQSVRSG